MIGPVADLMRSENTLQDVPTTSADDDGRSAYLNPR